MGFTSGCDWIVQTESLLSTIVSDIVSSRDGGAVWSSAPRDEDEARSGWDGWLPKDDGSTPSRRARGGLGLETEYEPTDTPT